MSAKSLATLILSSIILVLLFLNLQETNQNGLNQFKISKKDLSQNIKKESDVLKNNKIESLEVRSSKKNEIKSFIENLAYSESPLTLKKNRNKLQKILERESLAIVMKNLPNVIHFELSEAESLNIVQSLCRFKLKEEHGFEVLKLILNRIPRFQKDKFSLNRNCEGSV